MKNRNEILLILIAVALPIGLEFSEVPNLLGTNGLLYTIVWILLNYLLLRSCVEITKSYHNIFRLPGLKLRKTTYWINFVLYWVFFLYLNAYFIQQLYVRDNQTVNYLAHPLIAVVILAVFLLNLLFGIFPEVKTGETRIVEINSKGSLRYGREKFATVVGSYDDGVVIGTEYVPFDSIKSVSSNRKQESLVIKGKDDKGNYRINVQAQKSTEEVRKIILTARDEGKLDGTKVNIS